MPTKRELRKFPRGYGVPRSPYYLFPQNRLPKAPKIGQHVRIEGQPGEYVVLRLDTKRFAADLMLVTGKHVIEEKVPYFAIEPLIENALRHKPDDAEKATV